MLNIILNILLIMMSSVVSIVTPNTVVIGAPTTTSFSVTNPISSQSKTVTNKINSEPTTRINKVEPEYYKGSKNDGSITADDIGGSTNRNGFIFNPLDLVEHRINNGGAYGNKNFITSQSLHDIGHNIRYPGTNDNNYSYRDKINYDNPKSNGVNVIYDDGFNDYSRYKIPYGQPQVVDYQNNYDGGDDGRFPISQFNDPNWAGGYNNLNNYNTIGDSHGFFKGKQLTKEHLLPLAGAALLGLAAILVANPMLLQLGVVSAGKRKKRNILSSENKLKIYSDKLAYRKN